MLFSKLKKDEKLRFHVGAVSGVTTKPKIVSIGNDILVFDLPGLDDNNKQNSQVTLDRIKDVDIGILIVTGSSDSSQKANYDLLKEHCDLVYVVLNKVDEYAKKPKALEKVTEQWHQDLGLSSDEKIWHTCCDGYDPDDESEELSIFGVDDLREKVLADTHQALLDKKLKKITKEKALKLSKELEGKSIAAKKSCDWWCYRCCIRRLNTRSKCRLYYCRTNYCHFRYSLCLHR